MRQVAAKLYWYLVGAIVAQFFILLFRNVGFFPLWTSLEYMQLFAYIPLYNFKLIPYLYDAFKPFLVSHLMLTNEALILTEMWGFFLSKKICVNLRRWFRWEIVWQKK